MRRQLREELRKYIAKSSLVLGDGAPVVVCSKRAFGATEGMPITISVVTGRDDPLVHVNSPRTYLHRLEVNLMAVLCRRSAPGGDFEGALEELGRRLARVVSEFALYGDFELRDWLFTGSDIEVIPQSHLDFGAFHLGYAAEFESREEVVDVQGLDSLVSIGVQNAHRF